jgi:H+/Cl- antiporter ClcA
MLGQLIKILSNRIRTLVGCGASAGIAATFDNV